jgi:hypothetical protein
MGRRRSDIALDKPLYLHDRPFNIHRLLQVTRLPPEVRRKVLRAGLLSSFIKEIWIMRGAVGNHHHKRLRTRGRSRCDLSQLIRGARTPNEYIGVPK